MGILIISFDIVKGDKTFLAENVSIKSQAKCKNIITVHRKSKSGYYMKKLHSAITEEDITNKYFYFLTPLLSHLWKNTDFAF